MYDHAVGLAFILAREGEVVFDKVLVWIQIELC